MDAKSEPEVPSWFPLTLGGLWTLEFLLLGWAPSDREAWLLENLIAVPVVAILMTMRQRLPFSVTSWALIFGFLALHEVGSHYTYSLVPWMDWGRALLGWTPDWDRNHYDRVLHLAFGLLLARPLRELLAGPLAASPRLCRALAVCVICTFSGVYELLEWAAAELVDPDLGIGFVGAQGDIWDAQKDMVLALGGSVTVMVWGWIWEERPLAEVTMAGRSDYVYRWRLSRDGAKSFEIQVTAPHVVAARQAVHHFLGDGGEDGWCVKCIGREAAVVSPDSSRHIRGIPVAAEKRFPLSLGRLK